MGRSIEKTRNLEDTSDKAKPWELTEIVDPSRCRSVTMPESTGSASKVLFRPSPSPSFPSLVFWGLPILSRYLDY